MVYNFDVCFLQHQLDFLIMDALLSHFDVLILVNAYLLSGDVMDFQTARMIIRMKETVQMVTVYTAGVMSGYERPRA